MLQRVRDLPGAMLWFLTVRVVEVGVVALLLGGLLELKASWAYSMQYSGNGEFPPPSSVSVFQRLSGVALFSGYRLPMGLILGAVALAVVLVVLHRCQPVNHTRVLRWEWFTVWALTTATAVGASAVGAVAIVLGDPFAPADPTVVEGSVGPGYREQVLGNVSWPVGALLLLLPLGLWWARLPDMDDLEDSLAQLEDQEPGAAGSAAQAASASPAGSAAAVGLVGGRAAVPARPGPAPSGGGPRTGLFRRSAAAPRPRRGQEADGDAIHVDEVEQIEPVERLQPRGADRGDGSTASGYDGYFRHQ